MRALEGGPEGAELILFGAPNAGSGDTVQEPGWWDDQRLNLTGRSPRAVARLAA